MRKVTVLFRYQEPLIFSIGEDFVPGLAKKLMGKEVLLSNGTFANCDLATIDNILAPNGEPNITVTVRCKDVIAVVISDR